MSNQENKPTDVVQASPTQPKTYVVLQEINAEEMESWLYFLRYEGNEEALKKLSDQLESVEWQIFEDLSTFDLDIEHRVSEQTAKEMTKIDLNHYSFPRKFDGKLSDIDFKLKSKYSDEKKMIKIYDMLSYGKIDEYISEEDIDPEDLITASESEQSEHESESEQSESEDEKKDKKKNGKLPSSAKGIEIPRYAKAKKRHH